MSASSSSSSTSSPQPSEDTFPPRQQPPSFWAALKSISLSDLKNVHKVPCAREALLAGIGAGFGFGGVKLVLRSTIPHAANWAVGTFCGTSIVVYEACHYRRYKERVAMQRAIEIVGRQHAAHRRKVLEDTGEKGAEDIRSVGEGSSRSRGEQTLKVAGAAEEKAGAGNEAAVEGGERS